jgi:hypothetical protein
MQLTSNDDVERMRVALRSLLDDTAAFVNKVGVLPAVALSHSVPLDGLLAGHRDTRIRTCSGAASLGG